MAQCTIEDCAEPTVGRGWCSKHYTRWLKHGDPRKIIQCQNRKSGPPLRERFFKCVPIIQGDGCWEWEGYCNKQGYGCLSIKGIPTLAHRISWTVFKGPIKDAECVLHRCDNPPCINPAHLFLGTKTDNMADKMRKKRHKFGVSRGSKHGCAVLTEAQVLEIRASVGVSRVIGERYGVSGRTVRQIRTRETWTHLP